MTTRECTKGWKSYLTSSSFFILIIAVILILVRTYLVLEENHKLNNFFNKKVVVTVNDKVLVRKSIRTDSIKIFVKLPAPMKIDTTSKDSSLNKQD